LDLDLFKVLLKITMTILICVITYHSTAGKQHEKKQSMNSKNHSTGYTDWYNTVWYKAPPVSDHMAIHLAEAQTIFKRNL
jgi:hypothetical protein